MPEIEVTSVEVTTEVVHATSQSIEVGDAGPLTVTVSDVGTPGPAGPAGAASTVAGPAGAATPVDFQGTGFPEGVVTATVGKTYRDNNATSGAILWVKVAGTGNTGWKVMYGDTGWRTILTKNVGTNGVIKFHVRRWGNDRAALRVTTTGTVPTGGNWGTFPAGFKMDETPGASAFDGANLGNAIAFGQQGGQNSMYQVNGYLSTWGDGNAADFNFSVNIQVASGVLTDMYYIPSDAVVWPATLPGTAA